MDKQVNRKLKKGDIAFSVIKNMIIVENTELLKIIALKYNLDFEELKESYLKPAYYLPLVTKD